MTKFTKLKAAAVVASACSALFAAMPANALVYAVSRLEIAALDIVVTPTAGGADVGAATNYSFTVQNNASFTSPGSPTMSSNGAATCTGVVPTSTTCGNSPVLDAQVANAPGLMSARAENNFAVLGSNATQSFSNADSQITTAKLVTGGTTSTKQIAESLLNLNGAATANTEVKSNTTLVTNFFTTGNTNLDLSFQALLNLSGMISEGTNGFYTSQAGSNVTVTLTKNATSGGSQKWSWTPDGTSAGCFSAGITGSTCTETADEFDLNGGGSVSGNPDSYSNSSGGFKNFGLRIANLVGGNYSLSLTANTTTYVDRSIPEPGSLALVGLALAGLGFVGKRKTQK